MGELANLLPDCNPKDSWWRALPFRLSDVKVVESVRPIGFRFRKHAFNIAGRLNNKPLLVTGEADSVELAVTKAVAEFIERCTLIEYGKVHTEVKTSNGWAAHTNENSAQENAIRELVERDAVLRHWYTRTPFNFISPETLPSDILSWSLMELSRSEFPHLRILISEMGFGPSATAVLFNSDGYGVTGHCSNERMTDAIEGAIEEACRMAQHYLLKSYLTDVDQMKLGQKSRVDSGAHGVYYAHSEPFPLWMFGENINFQTAEKVWSQKNIELLQQKNQFRLSTVATLPLFVVRAESDSVIELTWGIESNEALIARLTGKVSANLFLEKQLNLEPHIIP